MTESAFTRGPFEQGLENNRIRIWAVMPSAIRYGIADICINRSSDSAGPSLAESEIANLFTAAPDLLAALKAIEHIVMSAGGHGVILQRILTEARAGIVLARGRF